MMYRIEMPIFNKPITPELTRLDDSFRGIPKAYGNTVKNGKELIPLIGTPDFDTSNLPVFDYFHLETSDKSKKLWQWCINDIHRISGTYSPSTFNFYISLKVKEILTKYVIAKPSGYVLSKLKYQRDFLDYYIFFCGRYGILDDTIFEESSFHVSQDRMREVLLGDYNGTIENFADFRETQIVARHNPGGDLFFKKIVIKKYYDFFIGFDDGLFYVSERLKKDLEANSITGIEFVEATDMEFQFLEDAPRV